MQRRVHRPGGRSEEERKSASPSASITSDGTAVYRGIYPSLYAFSMPGGRLNEVARVAQVAPCIDADAVRS